ncbi:cation diffusion facilitator family transporter [Pendulispora rubella]|uniref:Cation diffusion facilitator family transporter n=1 Tax=Pendulispora rubella TaxID=2741070 RepID=A0ABZ2L9D3_9BACT
MGHDHAHHDHAHAHFESGGEGFDDRRAYLIGIVLNLGFVVVEVAFGLFARSMSLIADAGHNLGDVLGLLVAGGASLLARRKPSLRRTYGFRRATILAALANGLLLVVATGAIVWESIGRLRTPGTIDGGLVAIVAAVGVLVNGASALFLMKGKKRDVNVQAAFIHLVADAAVSAGVVITGILIRFTGQSVLDPVVSIVLSLVILASTWQLLRRSLDLALDAVPEQIDPGQVRGYLGGLPGVRGVHDLHIWAMSSTETALTAHLVTVDGASSPGFLRDVCSELHTRFHIGHATLQVEAHDAKVPCDVPCRLVSDEAE